MTDNQCMKTQFFIQSTKLDFYCGNCWLLFLFGFQFRNIFWICYMLFFILYKAFFQPPWKEVSRYSPTLPPKRLPFYKCHFPLFPRWLLWRCSASSGNKIFCKAHMVLVKSRNLSINILTLLKLTRKHKRSIFDCSTILPQLDLSCTWL